MKLTNPRASSPVTVYDKAGNLIRGKLTEAPKQYIQGWTEFYKLKFKVTPDVLIPRPETELLVDEVLNCIKYYVSSIKGKITVIDVGTGSGAIAVAVAKNSKVNIAGIDISKKALEIAEFNAQKNKVDKKLLFIESDLLEKLNIPLIHNTDPSILIIVANLPYIPTGRINVLDPSVKDFEPFLALDGGFDGFELYRKLFQQIKEKFPPVILRPQAEESLLNGRKISSDKLRDSSLITRNDNQLKLLVCEIDDSHEQLAKREAQRYFPNSEVEVKKDLAQKPRILKISFN